MARAKYRITSADVGFVTDWVKGQFRDNKLISGEQSFEHVCPDHNKMQAWVEKNLDDTQARRMKVSIRASRRRSKQRSGRVEITRTVTLTNDAYMILSTISMCDNVTLSEVIQNHLEKQFSLALEALDLE